MNMFTHSDPEIAQAEAARAAFIRWRMSDVPGVYASLVPITWNLKELLTAESCIRAQMASDVEFINQPWKMVGPPCLALLDDTDLSGADLVKLGIETSIPMGQSDLPKPGRENDPAVIARIDAERKAFDAANPGKREQAAKRSAV